MAALDRRSLSDGLLNGPLKAGDDGAGGPVGSASQTDGF